MRFELSSIRSMLGLRFRDATTERPVTDGLRVRVRRADGAGSSTRAVRTVSGAYAAQGLDGLRAYERVPEDRPDTVAESSQEDYLVEVHDGQDRFVPTLFRVRLPYSPREELGGLAPVVDPPPEEQVESNGMPEPTVYLFSAVQRPVPAGQAVVYADLVTDANGTRQPAAHAVLEVRHERRSDGTSPPSNGNGDNGEETWFGIADADGRVAVPFPLPSIPLEELSTEDDGSGRSGDGPGRSGRSGRGGRRGAPRGGGNGGSSSEPSGQRKSLSMLSTRRWTLDVRVRHEPDALRTPSRAERPLLQSIFDQEAGILYETSGGAGSETQTYELSAGDPLVLRTEDLSALRIAPSSGGS